jgi:hypothetical protein
VGKAELRAQHSATPARTACLSVLRDSGLG